jgi:hypothetical protein
LLVHGVSMTAAAAHGITRHSCTLDQAVICICWCCCCASLTLL